MSYYDNARRIRPYIEKAVQSLEDYEALEVISLFKKWEEKEHYTIGERIQYKGNLYSVLQEHTSQLDWIPSDSPSLFSKVLIVDPEIIPEWEQPESTNAYSKGDKVIHNGKIWSSDSDNNIWEPGIYGWTEIIE